MDYDPTTYSGSAPHYVVGRPPYSPELEATLVGELGLEGTGRLLDVGCGPGILTLRLSHLFERAIGLDPDADMLVHARLRATHASVTNGQWVQALAEDLPAPAPGPFRLVTFGQSFHRTDESRVAEVVYDLLAPGGAVVVVTHVVEGRPKPPNPGAPEIPHDEIRAIIAEYLGSTDRSGQGRATVRDHTFEDVLARSRFGPPRVLFAPGLPDLVRSTESVLSGYLSMTFAAPHLFGDRLGGFCDDVRGLLRRVSTSGEFWDWPGDTELVIGRRW